MTVDRDVFVRVGWRLRTDLEQRELVDLVADRCVELRDQLRDEDLVVVGQVGPSIIPSMVDLLRDEAVERWSARVGDSVDEELTYNQWKDEAAMAAWEVRRAESPYELEDDPLHGETSSRYEDGAMP